MKNAIFYLASSEFEGKNSLPLISNLDRKYHVEWGNGSTYKIVCEDEDHSREFERHSGPLTGVTKLYYSPRMFITMAEDCEVHVCTNTGRLLHSLKGHKTSILGTIELAEKRLLTVGYLSEVKLWNPLNGVEVATLPVKVDDLYAIKMFHQSPYFAVSEASNASIWNYEGEQVATLEGLDTEINSVLNLSSDRWLIKAEGKKPSVWDSRGKRIFEFPFNFDFQKDLLELDDHQVLIKEANKQLSLWDQKGQKLSCHEPSEELSNLFCELQQDFNIAESHFQSHTNVIDYPHIRNPLRNKDSFFVARDEIEEQQLNLDSPSRRLFWNFFNRPLFAPIKTALKEQISHSRESLRALEGYSKSMKEQIIEHQNESSKRVLWSVIWLVLAVLGGGLAFAVSQQMNWLLELARTTLDIQNMSDGSTAELLRNGAGVFSGLTAILSLKNFLNSRNHKQMQQKKVKNLELLEKLPAIVNTLINNIKEYRRNILNQIPAVQDKSILNGAFVSEGIQSFIHDKLEKIARDECGLDKEDIIYTDNQAIVLKDWALIQDYDRRKKVISKLNTNNEKSFWSASGEMLFAVQFIQYIFLTEDKVDVFTTYYDFISDKCLGREANAFYYKDVTNISKREVEREGLSIFNSSDISATEITLSVASGEKIRLTILNEESASALVDSAKDNENLSIHEQLERLIAERDDYQTDLTMPDDEKQDELNFIESQIADLQNQVLDQDVEKISSKADEAIKNIRAQLHQHKQYEVSSEVLNENLS